MLIYLAEVKIFPRGVNQINTDHITAKLVVKHDNCTITQIVQKKKTNKNQELVARGNYLTEINNKTAYGHLTIPDIAKKCRSSLAGLCCCREPM